MDRILLIESAASCDSPMMRVLEKDPALKVDGRTTSVNEALRVARAGADAIVIDLWLANALTTIRQLRRQDSATAILAIDSNIVPNRVLKAIEAGFSGTLSRYSSHEVLKAALDRFSAGEDLITSERILALRLLALTRKEIEVLQALADGLSQEQTARRMVVSRDTIRNHLSNARRKLDVHSTLQAVILAVRHGIVDDTYATH